MTKLGLFENPTYRLDPQHLKQEIKNALQSFASLRKEKGRKRFLGSSHRAVPPKETLRKINPQVKRISGITRVADVTGLDVLGIPNYIAVRPNAFFSTPLEGGRVSVFNGKGFTKEQAKASALMEAIERYCGEPFERRPLIASYQEMKRRITTINPNSLCFDQKTDPIYEKAPIEWKIGVDLFTQKPTALQAVNVFAPYVAPFDTAIVNPTYSTTGLASGNTPLEATVHALLEIVERYATTPQQKSVERIEIPIAGIQSPQILQLIRKIEKHRIKLKLLHYETGLGLTVCRALIDDPITRDPHLLCYGSGCHLSKEVALIRAITEAIQTRLTIIAGTREDLLWDEVSRNEPSVYEKLSKKFWEYYESEKTIAYGDLPHKMYSNFQKDLSFILKRLKKKGLRQSVAVEMTNPDLNIPVVRVIVPNLPIRYQGPITNHKD